MRNSDVTGYNSFVTLLISGLSDDDRNSEATRWAYLARNYPVTIFARELSCNLARNYPVTIFARELSCNHICHGTIL